MKTKTDIKDYDRYNLLMRKSMLDKVFFMDKINASLIVDFGCADGTLFNFIKPHSDKDTILMGFDPDEKMIEIARKNNKNFIFTSNWDAIKSSVSNTQDNHSTQAQAAIILSSVIHEVYHYSTPEQIDEFWDRVFNTGFDYIVIRDMIPSRTINRQANVNDIAKVYRKFLYSKELQDFETNWGSVENHKNLVHFLLKYRYMQPNWAREVKENYMPLYREDLLALLDERYEITYHEHYVLPFIKESINKDFGIDLVDPTHLKIILRSKK